MNMINMSVANIWKEFWLKFYTLSLLYEYIYIYSTLDRDRYLVLHDPLSHGKHSWSGQTLL